MLQPAMVFSGHMFVIIGGSCHQSSQEALAKKNLLPGPFAISCVACTHILFSGFDAYMKLPHFGLLGSNSVPSQDHFLPSAAMESLDCVAEACAIRMCKLSKLEQHHFFSSDVQG